MAADTSTTSRLITSLLTMPRTRFIVAAVATLALFVGWTLWNLTWIEQQSDPFYSDAANQNPFLAAQLFLQHLGHDVSEGDNDDALEHLPEGNAVLVLASGRAHLSEQQQQVLLEWINHGGHLVTLATREWNDRTEAIDDLLQRQFDVAAVRTGDASMELVNLLFRNSSDDNSSDDSTETPANVETPTDDDSATESRSEEPEHSDTDNAADSAEKNIDSDTDTSTAKTDNEKNDSSSDETVVMSDSQCLVQTPLGTTEIDWFDDQHLIADIGGKLRLEIGDVEPLLSAADSLGLQLVQFSFGKGKITFLTNMNMWNNRQIGNFDNAHLLALLAGAAERIVILHNFDAVPLGELLRHYFPATLIMMIVLIIMIIYHHQLRWGAIISTDVPPRRSLWQHIGASGRFLWQHHQLTPLVKRLQQQIVDQMTRLHQNQITDREDLLNLLVTVSATGIGRERLRHAMGDTATATDDLLDQIRLLQTIRNSL